MNETINDHKLFCNLSEDKNLNKPLNSLQWKNVDLSLFSIW